jgi:hypothetical protein
MAGRLGDCRPLPGLQKRSNSCREHASPARPGNAVVDLAGPSSRSADAKPHQAIPLGFRAALSGQAARTPGGGLAAVGWVLAISRPCRRQKAAIRGELGPYRTSKAQIRRTRPEQRRLGGALVEGPRLTSAALTIKEAGVPP